MERFFLFYIFVLLSKHLYTRAMEMSSTRGMK